MHNPFEPPKADLFESDSNKRSSRLVELAAHSIFPRLPDGRIVFRPWGKFGGCYALDEAQRLLRGRVQAAFWAASLVVTVAAIQCLSTKAVFAVVLPIEVAFQYLLFAIYTRGLSRTEPPAIHGVARAQRRDLARARLREHSRLVGKPVLWLMLLGSLLFVLVGAVIAACGGPMDSALETMLFFGACSVLFARQLRNM